MTDVELILLSQFYIIKGICHLNIFELSQSKNMCVFVELENTLPENILQYEMLESVPYSLR